MAIDVLKLPSGKMFARRRFIALIPEAAPEYFQLYLEGCDKPIRIDRPDAMVIETTFAGSSDLIFSHSDILVDR